MKFTLSGENKIKWRYESEKQVKIISLLTNDSWIMYFTSLILIIISHFIILMSKISDCASGRRKFKYYLANILCWKFLLRQSDIYNVALGFLKY